MKVSLLKNGQNHKDINFGYKWGKDEHGRKQLEVSYPYDPEKQDCYLEVFNLAPEDRYNNFSVSNKAHTRDGADRIKLEDGKLSVNLAKTYGITQDKSFAYHFVLKDRNSNYEKAEIEAGLLINERYNKDDQNDQRVYNIVPAKQALRSRGGAMKLINIDAQHVGSVYNSDGSVGFDKDLAQRGYNGVKSLTNRYGGTLAGLEKALDNDEYAPFSEILTLPVTAQKDVYWTENLYQIDSSIGNINNFASLQRKLFAKGINLVSDGAFVNEGLTGVHFSNMLKWGTDSPYFRWFKASSMHDKPVSLGIFPKYTQNVSYKFVNLPVEYKQNASGHITSHRNKKYDSSKPSYIQFFDTRLASKEQQKDTTNLIQMYDKMNTDNLYKLTTHNDSVIPYPLEIKPEHIEKNVYFINQYNKQHPDDVITLGSYKAARMLSKMPYFSVDKKFESGFETWDSNPDIARLNFMFSNSDLKALKNITPSKQNEEAALIRRANAQVRDYTVESGTYWTKFAKDAITLYAAKNIGKFEDLSKDNYKNVYNFIVEHSDNKVFSKSTKEEVKENEVKNVLANRYLSERTFSDADKKSQILEGLMNTPIDSVEFGNNLVGVLASPLISKRASSFDDIGRSRYELFMEGDKNLPAEYAKTYNIMNSIYQNEMQNFATKVLDEVNNSLPEDNKLFDGEEVTKYGKYVLPMVMPQIARYALIKSLVPKVGLSVDDEFGEISYDYDKLKQTHLQTLGITNAGSPQDEALMVLSELKKGMNNLHTQDLVSSISKQLKDTSAASFALADLVVTKLQAGLDYRIDATKDIADIESLRNGQENLDDIWSSVTDFWKSFAHAVLKENPHSYMVAEITNLGELQGKGHGDKAEKFKSKADIKQKFFRETGITAEANYEDYFYNIAKFFAKSFEDGNPSKYDNPKAVSDRVYEILVGSADSKEPLFRTVSLPSVLYTYSFINNHDKPRALHCAALDMGMFYADLNNKRGKITKDFRMTAYKLLNDKFFDPVSDSEVAKYNFTAVSPKAIAMGLALRKSFINVLENYKDSRIITQKQFDDAFKAVSKSVSALSGGKFMGQHFEPDSFGIKPFDANIEQVLLQAEEQFGLDLPADLRKRYADDVFGDILSYAAPKLLAMMKYLVALPGMPTLFDGDDYCGSGYDSETKNMFLATRQKVHEEWAQEGHPLYKKFIKDYKNEFDKVMSVRKNPKCNALNNGSPHTLPPQNARRDFESNYHMDVPAIFRMSTDGRMAISLLNPAMKHSDKQRFAFDHEFKYEPENLILDSIKLNFTTDNENRNHIMDGSLGKGLKGLKKGLIFRNVEDENDTYKVEEVNGLYFLKRQNGDKLVHLYDTTLNLYYVPENTPLTFTGGCSFKQNSSYAINSYNHKPAVCAQHLELVSK